MNMISFVPKYTHTFKDENGKEKIFEAGQTYTLEEDTYGIQERIDRGLMEKAETPKKSSSSSKTSNSEKE